MVEYHPVEIVGVASRSAGARCGLRRGDHLLAINDMLLRDVIDARIYGGEPELQILFERDSQTQACQVTRRYGEPLGLDFAEELFNEPPRRCRNNCDFCFVAQMAPGLRTSLYVKDDDYRLSFLHGNYITLTNLDEDDWERIKEQYLTPLYVSVHATEPDVRVGLMRNPRAGMVLDQLHRLMDLGIEVHTQAVLVPGRNDGIHLDQTIADLAALYPGVQDLSVVPVGLTRWMNPYLRPYTDPEARQVLDQLLGWQTRLKEELGVNFVYPSDEWFLRAGKPVPAIESYDGLLPAMIENGVGMVRSFLNLRDSLKSAALELDARRQTWVTGTLFAPTLKAYAASVMATTDLVIDVVPVSNHFFGETVTVAGLLAAEDILDELRGRELGDVVVIPDEVFRGPDRRSLDGVSAVSLALALDRPVHLAGVDAGNWNFHMV